jgi:hypothetical protein
MTAIGVINRMTATLDALMHGRFSAAHAETPLSRAKTVSHAPSPAIEMTCLRCGVAVKANFPADDEREDVAFECHGCGTVARWV